MSGWPATLQPTLEGQIVRLEPLGPRHEDDLFQAARPGEIWTWICEPPARTRASWADFFAAALAETAAGSESAFATVDAATGRAIGSTRFLALRPEDRGLEIGWTWLARTVWGTGVNVETKLLLLTHAFEIVGCRRVEFKTDARNERSRGALEALGAQFEGVLRKHMVVHQGAARDSAYYSVIDDEWPHLKVRLEDRLTSLAAERS